MIVIVVLWSAVSASAGTVLLRQSAVVSGDGRVLLGDVALLEGDDVQALSEVELVHDRRPGRFFEITLDEVRDALDAHGVNWGRVALRGSRCTVRQAIGEVDPEVAAVEVEPVQEPQSIDVAMPPTVRTRVALLLARLFGVENSNLRVLFDAQDEEFLQTPEWGRRVELQPNSVGSSSRQSITVRVYEGDRLVESRTIRVDVTIRREVVVVRSSQGRRVQIEAGDVALENLWMSPNGTAPVERLKDAIGMLTRTRLKEGAVLRESQIERPVLVKRGERLTVHCLNGGVALRVQARALRDGKRGEQIECVLEGRDRSFLARVSDRGVAVMVLDAPMGELE